MAKPSVDPSQSFHALLDRLRKGSAGQIVDCLHALRDPEFAEPMTDYLARSFGTNPKTTRVLIRAGGSVDYRPLHDLFADRLLDPDAAAFRIDLLDALGKTGRLEYAGLFLPFLDDQYGFEVQSTAIHSLGLLGAPLAIAALLKIMERKTGQLRELAVEALRAILSKQMDTRSIQVSLARFSRPFQKTFQEEFGIVVLKGPPLRGTSKRKPVSKRTES